MFYQPKDKLFANTATDTTHKDKLVIGVAINKEARAYPIEIIGYHHQVKDTVGGQPILVTYCTVCRTGRVYSPFVKGRPELFRLVGMDHFNAMFEDAGTGSWWQQATGVAITGPLKGARLPEIPSAQMSLGDWQTLHPGSLTLQPDPHFKAKYDSLKGYDEGTILPDNRTFYALTRPDSLHFHYDTLTHLLKDERTGGTWKADGECVEPMCGT